MTQRLLWVTHTRTHTCTHSTHTLSFSTYLSIFHKHIYMYTAKSRHRADACCPQAERRNERLQSELAALQVQAAPERRQHCEAALERRQHCDTGRGGSILQGDDAAQCTRHHRIHGHGGNASLLRREWRKLPLPPRRIVRRGPTRARTRSHAMAI